MTTCIRRPRLAARIPVALLVALFATGGWRIALSQEAKPAEAEKPAEAAKADAEAKPKESAEKDDDLVQLSLNNAKIDVVIKWLGQTTGKTIIRDPKVNAQLNVMSSKKMSKRDAIRMVYQALQLQGVAAVEDKEVLYLVPEDKAKTIPPLWINGDPDAPLQGRQFVVRAFDIEKGDPTEIRGRLNQVLSPDAKVEVIPEARRIVITDRADNVRLAGQMIAEFDVVEGVEMRTELIELNHVKAKEMADLLTKLYADGGPAPAGREGEKDGEPKPVANGKKEKITFNADPSDKRILVTAPETKFGDIRALIQKLDNAKPADVGIRILKLKHLRASDLASDLSSLFRRISRYSRYSYSSRSGDSQREIVSQDSTNSLVILSSEAEFEEIRKIVEQVDISNVEKNVMEIIELKNADAGDIAQQLTDLYSDEDPNSRSYRRYYYYDYYDSGSNQEDAKIRFVPDRRRNAIFVLAPSQEMAKIKQLINDLDIAVEGAELAPLVLPLTYLRAYDVEDILNTLFIKKDRPDDWYWYDDYQEEDQDIGRLYGKVRLTSDSYTNSLIVVSNSKENLDAIRIFVEELDKQSPTGETTLRVPLNYARAITVSNNLNILFAQTGAAPMRAQGPERENRGQPQQQQENDTLTRDFEMREDVNESGYFPWLGSGREERQTTMSGRTIRNSSNLVGKVRIVPDHRTNALLITTNSHLFKPVLDLVNELDIPTAQVLIEAKIVEISVEDRERLGTRFSPDGARVFDTDDFENSLIGSGSGSYREVFSGSVLPDAMRTGIIDTAIDLDVLMQFLRRNSQSRIRAEPTINVSNNGLGQVFVGSRIPFIERSQLTTEGARNDTFDYINVGVTFEVKPHINADDEVALNIRVEASSQRPGETLFGGAIIDTRDYRTDVTVKSGSTLVLGGVIRQEESEIEYKVPILGDIPVLGWFFRKQDSSVRDVELMVFIRPIVTRSPEEAEKLRIEQENRARSIRQWRDELRKKKLEQRIEDGDVGDDGSLGLREREFERSYLERRRGDELRTPPPTAGKPADVRADRQVPTAASEAAF